MIKDLFGILVTVNVSVINYMMLENLDYKNRKCRNKLVDILVEECSENDGENEMIYIQMTMEICAILVQHTCYYLLLLF